MRKMCLSGGGNGFYIIVFQQKFDIETIRRIIQLLQGLSHNRKHGGFIACRDQNGIHGKIRVLKLLQIFRSKAEVIVGFCAFVNNPQPMND
ncbi:MAG TPA: hypothetical protein DD856_03950 [Sulfobacillus sp.]|nr:hypothetical protein [Sulfobacillus sp.]